MDFEEVLDSLVIDGQYGDLTTSDVCNKMIDLYGHDDSFMDDLLCAALGNEEAIEIIEGFVKNTLDILMKDGDLK